MISREYDQRVGVKSFCLQEGDQAPKLRVCEGNLTVVQPILIVLAVGRRRPVWIVRVIQVHPEKEFALRILAQPIQSNIGHHIPGTLHHIEIRFLHPIEIEVVIIEIESLVQAESRIQDGRSDYSARRISLLPQNGCERGLLGIELIAAEVVYAAQRGIRSSENRRMCRQGDRNRSVSEFKTCAVRRKRIDIRSVNLGVSIATKMISPQCINRDDDNV